MLKSRIMPCLLLMERGLYKTVKFKNPVYVGDPVNAIKIYNEKEVDELIFLDITASVEGRKPDLDIIREIASECFMPLCYGGGITMLDEVKQILEIGVEKIALNTSASDKPKLVSEAANAFGNQSVIVSIDVKRNFLGKAEVYKYRGTKGIGEHPVPFARRMEDLGAGELLVTSIDREGTWSGYDLELLESITSAVNIPVIANGGAGTINHLEQAVIKAGVSGVAMGSMVVFQKKGLGVLINFPRRKELEKILS